MNKYIKFIYAVLLTIVAIFAIGLLAFVILLMCV